MSNSESTGTYQTVEEYNAAVLRRAAKTGTAPMSEDLIERLRAYAKPVKVLAGISERGIVYRSDTPVHAKLLKRAELERLRGVERAGILLANAAYNIHQLQQHVTSDQMDSLKSAQMDFDAARALSQEDPADLGVGG